MASNNRNRQILDGNSDAQSGCFRPDNFVDRIDRPGRRQAQRGRHRAGWNTSGFYSRVLGLSGIGQPAADDGAGLRRRDRRSRLQSRVRAGPDREHLQLRHGDRDGLLRRGEFGAAGAVHASRSERVFNPTLRTRHDCRGTGKSNCPTAGGGTGQEKKPLAGRMCFLEPKVALA